MERKVVMARTVQMEGKVGMDNLEGREALKVDPEGVVEEEDQ